MSVPEIKIGSRCCRSYQIDPDEPVYISSRFKAFPFRTSIEETPMRAQEESMQNLHAFIIKSAPKCGVTHGYLESRISTEIHVEISDKPPPVLLGKDIQKINAIMKGLMDK